MQILMQNAAATIFHSGAYGIELRPYNKAMKIKLKGFAITKKYHTSSPNLYSVSKEPTLTCKEREKHILLFDETFKAKK